MELKRYVFEEITEIRDDAHQGHDVAIAFLELGQEHIQHPELLNLLVEHCLRGEVRILLLKILQNFSVFADALDEGDERAERINFIRFVEFGLDEGFEVMREVFFYDGIFRKAPVGVIFLLDCDYEFKKISIN